MIKKNQIVGAPWSREDVKKLKDYQKSGCFHPYTSGCSGHEKVDLIPRELGWYCPKCRKIVQDWCLETTLETDVKAAVDMVRQYKRTQNEPIGKDQDLPK